MCKCNFLHFLPAFLLHTFIGLHIAAFFNAKIFGIQCIQRWLAQLQTHW